MVWVKEHFSITIYMRSEQEASFRHHVDIYGLLPIKSPKTSSCLPNTSAAPKEPSPVSKEFVAQVVKRYPAVCGSKISTPCTKGHANQHSCPQWDFFLFSLCTLAVSWLLRFVLTVPHTQHKHLCPRRDSNNHSNQAALQLPLRFHRHQNPTLILGLLFHLRLSVILQSGLFQKKAVISIFVVASQIIISVTKSSRTWARHMTGVWEKINAHRVLMWKSEKPKMNERPRNK